MSARGSSKVAGTPQSQRAHAYESALHAHITDLETLASKKLRERAVSDLQHQQALAEDARAEASKQLQLRENAAFLQKQMQAKEHHAQPVSEGPEVSQGRHLASQLSHLASQLSTAVAKAAPTREETGAKKAEAKMAKAEAKTEPGSNLEAVSEAVPPASGSGAFGATTAGVAGTTMAVTDPLVQVSAPQTATKAGGKKKKKKAKKGCCA